MDAGAGTDGGAPPAGDLVLLVSGLASPSDTARESDFSPASDSEEEEEEEEEEVSLACDFFFVSSFESLGALTLAGTLGFSAGAGDLQVLDSFEDDALSLSPTA